MGIRPRYEPAADPSLAWAVVEVVAIAPARATWSSPAEVTLAVREVIRPSLASPPPPPGGVSAPSTPLPERLALRFGAPDDAGEQRFYATRFSPPDAAAHLARLDAQEVALPTLGSTIIVWLREGAPGVWHVPSNAPVRWIEDSEQARDRVREQLGLAPVSLSERVLRKIGLD